MSPQPLPASQWMVECICLIQARYVMRNRDMTPAAIELYRAALMNLDPTLARAAVVNVCARAQYLPEPQEIREEYEALREERARKTALPAGATGRSGRPIERFELVDPATTEEARAAARAHITRLAQFTIPAGASVPAAGGISATMPQADPEPAIPPGGAARRSKDGQLVIDMSRIPDTRPDDPVFQRWPHLRAPAFQSTLSPAREPKP